MAGKIWNWQSKEWPHFFYEKGALEKLEHDFLQKSGIVTGVFKHIKPEEKETLLIQMLSNEAMKTSEIEGDHLDRNSVQESVKKNLGLVYSQKNIPLAESGVAEMMVSTYKTFAHLLTHNQLHQWHKMLVNGRRDLVDIGGYRTHEDPMQIVSGHMDRRTVFFEAPPSVSIVAEMDNYIKWYNDVHSESSTSLSPLAKAGIAHFYFVTIHPFEDGNGRIGRAIAVKSLSQSIQKPALVSLSEMIEENKKEYFRALQNHNRTLDLTDWLIYFSKTILDAQENTIKIIDFLIQKAQFFDRFSGKLNKRQIKVARRIFKEGHEGFKGGLSAENYKRIAKTSASTTTRDLKNFVEIGAFCKSGKLKGTRYYLNLDHPH